MGSSSVTGLRNLKAGSSLLLVASWNGLGVTVEVPLGTAEGGVVTLSSLASPAPAVGRVMVMLGVMEGATTTRWVLLGTGEDTLTSGSAGL